MSEVSADEAAQFLAAVKRLDARGMAVLERLLAAWSYATRRGWEVPQRINVAAQRARSR